MKPVNHIFLFRSNVNLFNERINKKTITNLQRQFKHEVAINEQGQVLLSRATAHKDSNSNVNRNRSTETSEELHAKSKETLNSKDFEIRNGTKDNPLQVNDNDKKYSGENNVWVKELSLTTRNKITILQGGWVDDIVINTASRLVRSMSTEVNGLQDVILAEKHGFLNPGGSERFVQIININRNHWITISNVFGDVNTITVYDSFHALNVRKSSTSTKAHNSASINDRAEKEIRYPLRLEEAACQLSKVTVPSTTPSNRNVYKWKCKVSAIVVCQMMVF